MRRVRGVVVSPVLGATNNLPEEEETVTVT